VVERGRRDQSVDVALKVKNRAADPAGRGEAESWGGAAGGQTGRQRDDR
jgi:hypothetical protein